MTTKLNLALTQSAISYEKASSLLNRRIEISYQNKGAVVSVELTIEKIYQSCQKKLERYPMCRSVFKGSSVASIFSNEPVCDIDIHTFIDLTSYPIHERVAQGYGIKWAILRGIVDAVINDSTSKTDQLFPIAVEDLLFEEENIMFSTKSQLPFNIHTLRIGKPMIEFTCVANVKEQQIQLRNFDFNSGALEMHIDTENNVTLYSHLPDLDITLQQISSRILDTIEPEKIKKNGVERYLSKIILSGYSDPSKTLYPSLLVSGKKDIIDDGIESFEKILNHMRSKGLSDFASVVALWIMRDDTKEITDLSHHCREAVLMQSTFTSEGTFIKSLIERQKKHELCWYLLLFATKFSIINHREERSLQLQLYTFPLFDQENTDKEIYITFPLDYLTEFESDLDMHPFISITTGLKSLVAPIINVEHIEELKGLFARHLAKKELFPILSAVFERFELKTTKAFVKLFMQWSEGFSSAEMEQIPSHLMCRIVNRIEESDITSKRKSQQVLEIIFQGINILKLYTFDKASSDYFVTKLLLKSLKENDQRVLRFAKQMSIDFIDDRQRGGEGLTDRDKLLIQMIYVLYQKSLISIDEVSETIHICLQYERGDIALKFLDEIIKREESIDIASIYTVILALIRHSADALLPILQTHGQLFIAKRTGEIEQFSGALIDLLHRKDGISTNTFSTLGMLCFTEQERICIFCSLFQSEEINFLNTALPSIISHWQINLTEVLPIEELQLNQLLIFWKCLQLEGINEKNIKSVEKTLLAILANFEEDITFAIASQVAKEFHQLFFIKSIRFSCFSIFPISKTLCLIDQIINATNQSDDDERYNAFCIDSLDVLKKHFSIEDIFDPSTLLKFRSVHKLLFSRYIDHPLWNIFWTSSKGKNMDREFDSWIHIEDILPSKSLEMMCTFLQFFEIKPTFIFDFLIFIRGKEIEKFQMDFIFEILKSIDAVVWNCKRPPQKHSSSLAVLLVDIIYPYMEGPLNNIHDIEKLNLAFNAMAVSSWYLDEKNRDVLIKKLLNLLVSSKQGAIFFCMSGKTDLILMNCVERALEEKNWEQLAMLKEIYVEYISIEGRQSFLQRKQVSLISENRDRFLNRCALWLSIVSKQEKALAHFSPYGFNRSPAIELFIIYLSDMISSLTYEMIREHDSTEISPDYRNLDSMKQECIVQFFYIFDALIKNKRHEGIFILPFSLKLHAELNEVQRLTLTDKILQISCELLKSFAKEEKSQRHWIELTAILNSCNIALSIAKPEHIQKQQEMALSRFIETAAVVITQTYPELALRSTFVRHMSFFEGTLSKDAAYEHLISWGNSIIARKDTVFFEELSLFSIFIFQLDEMFSPRMYKGINMELFQDKLFVNERFFKNTKSLELFIELFHIGFSRFYEKIGSEWSDDTFARVDIFSVFHIYHLFIQNGVYSKIKNPEFIRLQNAMINMLESAIFLPKCRLSLPIARTMLNFILTADQHGRIILKASNKEQMNRMIKLFAQSVEIMTIDRMEISEHNYDISILKSVFEFHKEIFRKTLEKDVFLQHIRNWEILTSHSIPATSSRSELFQPEKVDEEEIAEASKTENIENEDHLTNSLLEKAASIQSNSLSLFNFYRQKYSLDAEQDDNLVTAFFESIPNSK